MLRNEVRRIVRRLPGGLARNLSSAFILPLRCLPFPSVQSLVVLRVLCALRGEPSSGLPFAASIFIEESRRTCSKSVANRDFEKARKLALNRGHLLGYIETSILITIMIPIFKPDGGPAPEYRLVPPYKVVLTSDL